MRKGERLKPWTIKEERLLIELAKTESIESIATQLGRSKQSVLQKAKRLRSEGTNISLRHYSPRKRSICPSCGSLRSEIGRKTGICRACEIKILIAKVELKISEVYQKLPPSARQVYSKTEAQLESNSLAKPVLPRLTGLNAYQKAKLEDLYLEKLEAWEVASLNRLLRAKRRRYERMLKKTQK